MGWVTDLQLWTECYTALVVVLSVRYLGKTPHFMAYLYTITRTSQRYEGSVWASYGMLGCCTSLPGLGNH